MRLTFKGHTNIVTAVAFTPDGSRIVTGSCDKTAKVWDAQSGQPCSPSKGIQTMLFRRLLSRWLAHRHR